MKPKDHTGKIFGRLTVIEHRGSDALGQAMWLCRCECGNTKIIRAMAFCRGATKSCGCLQRENGFARGKASARHGMEKTPEYKTWTAMVQRCSTPTHQSFASYGGRGIRVCERWKRFENFYADVGPRPSRDHSIDRIDNDGHYEPSNCRWATRVEQQSNRRVNWNLTLNGRTLTTAQWSRETGIGVTTIRARLRRGWPVEKALTAEVDFNRHPSRWA